MNWRLLQTAAWASVATLAFIFWVYPRDADPKPRRVPAAPPQSRIETTLPMPGPGVHIVAIPNEFTEVTRCLVAVTDAGFVSTSCAPKELDTAPSTDN